MASPSPAPMTTLERYEMIRGRWKGLGRAAYRKHLELVGLDDAEIAAGREWLARWPRG